MNLKTVWKWFLLSIFISFFQRPVTQAQGEANQWVLADQAGLNFSFGDPVPRNSLIDSVQSTSAISTKNGELLFYSNGEKVWNREHRLMQNGTDLNGSRASLTCSMIIPWPQRDSLYFLFTTEAFGRENGLQYSVIDMRLDNGLGAVVQKNVPLLWYAEEMLGITLNTNGRDAWVIAHRFGNDKFYAFPVDSIGVGDSVVSKVGSVHEYSPFIFLPPGVITAEGNMRISPQGDKLAIHSLGLLFIELFSFDSQTGQLSFIEKFTHQDIYPNSWGHVGHFHGVEFSPNGRYLYETNRVDKDTLEGRDNYDRIFQYDVNLPGGQIQNSRQLIYEAPTGWGPRPLQLQKGPDGNIYSQSAIGGNWIGRIIKSDHANASYEVKYLKLSEKRTYVGMCNFPSHYFRFHAFFDSKGNCQGDSTFFYASNPQPTQHWEWNFGDPSSGVHNTATGNRPVHLFSQTGTYTVRLIAIGSSQRDTFEREVTIYSAIERPFIEEVDGLCFGDSLELSASIDAESYLWSTGSHQKETFVKESGVYFLTVEKQGCVAVDSIAVEALPEILLDLGKDTLFCDRESWVLESPVHFDKYLWSTGDTVPIIQLFQSGNYQLQVWEEKCSAQDTIEVLLEAIPNFDLGNDTLICGNDSLQIASGLQALTYQWAHGPETDNIWVSTEGKYSLIVSNGYGCSLKDSLSLSLAPYPVPPVIEQKGNLLIGPPTFQYQWYWNDSLLIGATGVELKIQGVGKYTLEVTNEGGCRNRTDFLLEGIPCEKLGAFPNPNDGNFSVLTGLGEVEYLKLSDLNGRKVWEWEGEGAYVMEIELRDELPLGVYILQLETGECELIQKVEVIR